ncbi:MAG: hypothetical protein IJB31_09160 [Akkermansia sp.]|nr:hypothetical protein [Akkermansia sp.]
MLDGRKPAFLEAFPELVKGVYNTIPHDENIRYVAGDYEHCIYNADSVRKVLALSANSSELDSVVKNLVNRGNSGMILGYGYNFMDNPRGWAVSITANGQEISGFDAPPNRKDANYFASERTKDFQIAFPNLTWEYDIIER